MREMALLHLNIIQNSTIHAILETNVTAKTYGYTRNSSIKNEGSSETVDKNELHYNYSSLG
jgi:hypothetical protein